MKGLPLAYNKDMQEDKEAIFDAVDTLKECLVTFIPMLDTVRVLEDNMRKAASKGFINATDVADYLTKKGVPFRDAYKVSGTLVAHCIQNDTVLEDLSLETFKEFNENFEQDIFDAISLETCVSKRLSEGGPAPKSVEIQIERAKEKRNK